jgi:acylphosphatase
VTVARQVRVTGRVQGVFFRAWTRDEARRLGLSGWVRNCADGTVEAHVEGDEGAVAELIGKLHHGPSGAEVSDVEVENAEAENLGRFEVRH